MPTLLTPPFPSCPRTVGAQHVEDLEDGAQGDTAKGGVKDLEDDAQGDTAKGGAVPGEAISLGERSRQWASSPLCAHRAHERPMPPASIAHPDPACPGLSFRGWGAGRRSFLVKLQPYLWTQRLPVPEYVPVI